MRGLFLALLIIVAAFVAYSYWGGNANWRLPFGDRSGSAVGTTGSVDVQKARERGAELGDKAAKAANKVEETVGEAATTAKIKAKMALDDTVKSRTIEVSTSGSTVTLSGTVRTPAERTRAVALAKE